LDHKDRRDRLALQDLQGLAAKVAARQDHKDRRGRLALRVLRDLPDRKVILGFLVRRARLDQQVRKENWD
jgi:hypothetical protein